MILFNAQHIFCNGKEDPFIFVNGKQVWPLEFYSYTIKFEWSPTKMDQICLDGMGWGDELGYIHSENVIWADYYDVWGSSYVNLSTSDIVNACEDNGQSFRAYTSELRFNIRGSDVGRYNEFTFKTEQYYQPAGNLKVSIIGYSTEPVVLAAKTVSMAQNTTYHVHIGEFDT